MTQARKTLVCVEETPFYHCIGRCVRRAYLCGQDSVSGQSFEHRREWMQDRLALLTQAFAVDLCAYALMSNHYHLIVKICPEQLTDNSEFEIIDRWRQLFAGPALVQRFRSGEQLSKAERQVVVGIIEEWRRRLADLSWFMRCLNEYIARRANREDGVTGHFWEARFKSQALLDEIALLQGMVYTDLNPIRAAMATSIQDSAWTSVQQRFKSLTERGSCSEKPALPQLAQFQLQNGDYDEQGLPFTLTDYLELVDATGRCCVKEKRGFIGEKVPRVLSDFAIDGDTWVARIRGRGISAGRALGSPDKLRQFAQRMMQKWVHGVSAAVPLYPS